MMRRALLGILILLVLTTTAGATTWNVSVTNFTFNPATLNILQGDTVVWTNTLGNHNVRHLCVPALFGNAIGVAPWTYTFVFNVPVGRYDYVCDVHWDLGMYGVVNVARRGRWNVSVANFLFRPANITATVGDTVVWTNTLGFHSVHHDAIPSLFGNSPASAPWTYSFVFNLPPANYRYICEIHPLQMIGNINLLVPQPLLAPDSLVVKADAPNADLTWTSVCGATGYRVTRSSVPDTMSAVLIGTTAFNDTTFSDTLSGAPGDFYYFIRAIR